MKHRLPQSPFKHSDSGRVNVANSASTGYSTCRNLVAHLLKTRPVIFWGGIWISIFLVSVVALGSLLSPSASSNRPIAAIAADAESTTETTPLPHQAGQVPLWMFGAIVLTCTAGSLLIAWYLKLFPTTEAEASKRVSRPSKAALRPVPLSHPGYPEPSRQLQPFSPTAPLPFPVLPTFVQSPPEPVVLAPADRRLVQKPTQKHTLPAQFARSALIAWLTEELPQPSYSSVNLLDPLLAPKKSGFSEKPGFSKLQGCCKSDRQS